MKRGLVGMNNKEIIEKWMCAFDDEEFQDKLQNYRNQIEKIIKDYIHTIKKDKSTMMFDSLESRIKSRDSFEQKLSRNDYVNRWELKDEKSENQKFILENLSDVIGFRISCYFKQDEKILFEKLKNAGLSSIVFDPNTNTKQANGHDIYKLEGLYNDECRFEIQIKSLVHNIWGEVEHKTIYKTRDYDCNIEDRRAITESTYGILTATDTQLNSLFKMNYDIDKMLKGLFYELTKKDIENEFHTDILGKAYNQFFGIFYKRYQKEIQEYVANRLLGNSIILKKISTELDSLFTNDFKERLQSRYLNYDFELVRTISKEIFEYKDEDDFYRLLFKILSPSQEEENYDDEDAFSDDGSEEELEENQSVEEECIEVVFARLKEFSFKEVKMA